jgi:hypothetical protein
MTFSMLRYVDRFWLHCGHPLAPSYTTSQLAMKALHLLEHLVLVDNLDAMLVRLLGGILVDACKVRVHHAARSGRVSDGAGTGLPVDREVIGGHICMRASRDASCTWYRKNTLNC